MLFRSVRVITDLDLDFIRQNLKQQLSTPLMMFGVTTDLLLLGIVLYILLYHRQKLKKYEEQNASQSQKLAELTIFQSEAELYYRQLFNSINDGIVVSEMDANGSLGPIVRVNKQASLILGRSDEELMRLTPMDILEANEKLWFPDIIHKLQADHSLLNQFRILTGEFHIFLAYLVISSVLIDTEGLWYGIFSEERICLSVTASCIRVVYIRAYWVL